MLITRECDYAVRVVRALAEKRGRLSVGEICGMEALTAPFAYKILKKLQRARIVKGYRGAHGGYTLGRRLDKLTLYDIYSAVDPDMFIIECLNGNYNCIRNGADGASCRVHRELEEIQTEIRKLLRRKSVAEILELK